MIKNLFKKLKKDKVELTGSMQKRGARDSQNLQAGNNKLQTNSPPAVSQSDGQANSKLENKNKRMFEAGLVSTKDIIAPSALEVDFDHIRIGNRYYRTLFVAGYPRFVGLNWLSPLINFDASLNVSMYVYPTEGKEILDDLRRKIAEMEAEISTDIQRGRVVNPATQAKLEDALSLQNDLAKGEERFFQFGLYITISADSIEELKKINKNIEAALGALMIVSKRATLQMEDGFITTLPLCQDRINITRNMDTTSLATTFPFVSSDLSDDKGIMYGINEHNGSLVIFDRFSMPNYNSVVFATSGAGKSYMIKLEAFRSVMMGVDVLIIDPENEYKNLCQAVGGQYIAFGYGEEAKINPFDLSLGRDEEDKKNALNAKVLSLHKLLKIMLGEMDAIEESIVDKAIMEAYRSKGITPDVETQNKEAPLLEDVYKVLIGMEEEKSKSLAARLEKYIKGSFAGIFNQKTNVNLKSRFVVFGIRNLEDSLRPVAMHIILDYIWGLVKRELKKRILVVDEAWWLMQYDDSAAFLRGVIKRGRKYFLGTTTITQDVEDFLETPYGKEIVTNSAIQVLLRQHSAAIDKVGEIFYLSEGEKQLLLSADKGEGIFFAGDNHVAIRVIASEEEHKLITSNPEELVNQKKKIEEKVDEAKKRVREKPVMEIRMKNVNEEGNEETKEKEEVKKPAEVKEKKEEREKIKTEEEIAKQIERLEREEKERIEENKKGNERGEAEKIKKGVLYQELTAKRSTGGGSKVFFVNRNEEKQIPQPEQLAKAKFQNSAATPRLKQSGPEASVGTDGQREEEKKRESKRPWADVKIESVKGQNEE